jgi:hypothetical protein
LKYIIYEPVVCIELALLFNELVEHSTFAHLKPTSAGFCKISTSGEDRCFEDDVEVNVWGESTSLKLQSNGKEDEEIIKRTLTFRT